MSDSGERRDLDRWMGDGGMPVIADLGACFTGHRPGAVEGTWRPRAPACNPDGVAQAGTHTVLLDAAMSLALLSLLPRDRRAVTISLTTQHLRPALLAADLSVAASVVRIGRTVGFAEARIVAGEELVTSASGAFALVARR